MPGPWEFIKSVWDVDITAQTVGNLDVNVAANALGALDTEEVTITAQTGEYHVDIAAGVVPGKSINHKFGALIDVAATYVPVTTSAIWLTPQVAGAVALRVKAGNGADTANGAGAREITLQGVDETGAEVTEAVATAGASASDVTSATFMRLYRLWVSESGTYTSPGTPPASHTAAIVIESAAAAEWGSIDVVGASKGQSQIAAYTVPLGKKAFINSYYITTDGAKPVDFLFMQRRYILETSAPYAAARTIVELYGIQNVADRKYPRDRRRCRSNDNRYCAIQWYWGSPTMKFEPQHIGN